MAVSSYRFGNQNREKEAVLTSVYCVFHASHNISHWTQQRVVQNPPLAFPNLNCLLTLLNCLKMIRNLGYVLSGAIASAATIQLGFDPADLIEGFGETSSVLIWVSLGGLGGLLLGLLVQGIKWTVRTLSGNWTRLGR